MSKEVTEQIAEATEVDGSKTGGALQVSLDRSSKSIRADRAIQIAEDGEIEFRRKIEDLKREIRRLEINRDSRLDMSGDNALSIIRKGSFDATEFVENWSRESVEIAQKELTLNVLEKQYTYLFGGKA